jgi:ornithine carbamoyltransferase
VPQVAQPRSEKGAAVAQPAPPLRHFLSISDLDSAVLARLLERAAGLKAESRRGEAHHRLPGVTAAMVFQKPSLRTRVSFEVGMLQLGGHALYLSPAEIQLGHREGVADAARVLSRYVQAIVARVFLHDDVVGLAREASVPVINALSDVEHPCQVLADLLTLKEHFGRLEGLTLAYVGDGNNVASSLLLAAPRTGINVRVATPGGYEPPAAIVEAAHAESRRTGGSVELFTDPRAAVRGADALYTDAWYSMGQEDEAELRQPLFAPYQVNAGLVAGAAAHAIVLHCLPAHRGQEITDEVLDGPRCVAYDQAENRLHAQKALLLHLLGSD